MAEINPIERPWKVKNIAGQQFGKLIASTLLGKDKRNRAIWHCECSCGKTVSVAASSLINGNTKSCGCSRQHINQTHGKRWTPEYSAWLNARTRCNNPKFNYFAGYGGRGIRMCSGWDDSSVFLADMGPRPTPKHSIDRIENNGHYSCGKCSECLREGWPANVHWATRSEQARNTRKSNIYTINGVTRHINEWAELNGINRRLIHTRIHRLGWPVEMALTIKSEGRRGRPNKEVSDAIRRSESPPMSA